MRSRPGTSPPARRDPGALAGIALAAGLFYAALFLYFAFRARFQVPYVDDWSWLASLADHPFTVGLWQPHNEHVIVIPRLLLWMDFWFWGWPGYATLAGALASHAVVAAVLIGACRTRVRREALFLGGVVLAGTCLTYSLQGTVFPGAVLFPLVAAFAMLAIWCLAHAAPGAAPRSPWRWILGSALMTVMAMLCLTNGLLLPFLLACLSLLIGLQPRTAALFGIVGVAGVLARYAIGGMPATVLTASKAATVKFCLAVFAGPVAALSFPLAVVIGACFVILASLALTRFCLGRVRTPADTVLAGTLAFLAASILMASLGRAQFDPSVAAESRYTELAAIAWASLILLVLPHGFASQRGGFAAVAATTVVLVAGLPLQWFVGEVWAAKADHLQSAGLSLAVGVQDTDWLWLLHPLGMRHIALALPELRDAGADFLMAPAIGRVETRVRAPACTGQLDAIAPRGSHGDLRIRGWLAEHGTSVRILDNTSRVGGLARPAPLVGHARATANDFVWAVVDTLSGRLDVSGRWLGFARRGAGPPYRAELIDSQDRVVCETVVTCCSPPREVAPRPELIVRGEIPEGVLDKADCTVIRGWAWDSVRPTIPIDVRIEASTGKEVVVSASQPRADLVAAGKGDGRHGFTVDASRLGLGPGTWTISASIAATGVPLQNGTRKVECGD